MGKQDLTIGKLEELDWMGYSLSFVCGGGGGDNDDDDGEDGCCGGA